MRSGEGYLCMAQHTEFSMLAVYILLAGDTFCSDEGFQKRCG